MNLTSDREDDHEHGGPGLSESPTGRAPPGSAQK